MQSFCVSINILEKGEINVESPKCGSSKIAGASFTLSPMSANFIEVIESALAETDTSKVWLDTDDVSTTARGKIVHVFDVTKAICLHAARTGEHVSFQATYSLGCPGDVEADAYLASDDTPSNLVNNQEGQPFAAAKFSLYPLGGGDYMETIYEQIAAMKKYVEVSKSHYSTKLAGGLLDIFNGLENVFEKTIDQGSSHTVMTVTVSMNSPSHN